MHYNCRCSTWCPCCLEGPISWFGWGHYRCVLCHWMWWCAIYYTVTHLKSKPRKSHSTWACNRKWQGKTYLKSYSNYHIYILISRTSISISIQHNSSLIEYLPWQHIFIISLHTYCLFIGWFEYFLNFLLSPRNIHLTHHILYSIYCIREWLETSLV